MNTRFGTIIVLVLAVIVAVVVARNFTPASTLGDPVATVTYVCSAGKTIDAKYYTGETKAATGDQPPTPGGSVALVLSDGRTMTLSQTVSADGARYANADESFVFWNKGNGALVLEDNQEKSYIGCIAAAPEENGLSKIYSNSSEGFSIRLPSLMASTSADMSSYKVDESYKYTELGPKKNISGIKFTIPGSMATGTNLSSDSYLSVEEIPNTPDCSAFPFLDGARVSTMMDGDTTYSIASSTGAGAGNRYEETVYALPGTNPCIAVRYFIHYGVIQNYPTGTVQEFDKQKLMNEFDAIRRSLVIVQ